MRIELRYVPDCPLTAGVRAALDECLQRTGISAPVEEFEGAYPSPTLLIDGIDVATGHAPTDKTCCRLDVPTRDQIVAALHRARHDPSR